MKQRSEIVLECKNKVIENLLQDFDRAEFQYSLQFKSHIETISKFMGIFVKVNVYNLVNIQDLRWEVRLTSDLDHHLDTTG